MNYLKKDVIRYYLNTLNQLILVQPVKGICFNVECRIGIPHAERAGAIMCERLGEWVPVGLIQVAVG